MTKRLSNRAALLWSAVETFSQQGFQIIVYIILARMISPEDFGLLAMIAIFFSVGQSLIDSGFSHALIQKRDADELDQSTVFYFNLLVGMALTGAIFLSSRWISEFYNEPDLETLTKVMSLIVVITSVGLVHDALSRKELAFRSRAIVSLISSALSGIVSVSMAVGGAGVWALASQLMLMRFFHSLFLWLTISWRPTWAFSFPRLRAMFGFGFRVLLVGLLNAFSNNMYAMVIGKYFSATDVGYYANAKRYQEFPSTNLTRIFNRVSLPAFARLQDDFPQLQDVFAKTLKISSLSVMPVMALLIGIAHPLFEVVLGPKWLPSAVLFQILCVTGMFAPIVAINANCLLALGKSREFLNLTLLRRAASVVGLIITFRFGLFWIVIGETVAASLFFLVNTIYTKGLINMSTRQQIGLVSNSAALALIIGVTSYTCTLVPIPLVWQICGAVVSSVALGFFFLFFFDRVSLAYLWTAIPWRSKKNIV